MTMSTVPKSWSFFDNRSCSEHNLWTLSPTVKRPRHEADHSSI